MALLPSFLPARASPMQAPRTICVKESIVKCLGQLLKNIACNTNKILLVSIKNDDNQ
jgi:hypothetical protein